MRTYLQINKQTRKETRKWTLKTTHLEQNYIGFLRISFGNLRFLPQGSVSRGHVCVTLDKRNVELSGQEALRRLWVPCRLGGYLSVRGCQLSSGPQLLHLYQVQWWPQMGSDGQGHQRMIPDLVSFPRCCDEMLWWKQFEGERAFHVLFSAMFYHVREAKAAGLDAAGYVTSTVRRREWRWQAWVLVHTLSSLRCTVNMPHPHGPIHNEDGFSHNS